MQKVTCIKEKCSGCGSCNNICPKDAITMKHTLTGTHPVIDEEKCVDCGLCIKACPVENKTLPQDMQFPQVYAARMQDSKISKKSASGGIFFVLARKIIREQGIVYGAVSGEDFRVCMKSASTEAELSAMQGSKYVESNTDYTFREVKKYLESGRKVLYSGLPCQIAGLLAFLGEKTYENLITADIVCHGAPSEVIYKDYLEYYEKKQQVKLKSIRHRYKTEDWKWTCDISACYETMDRKKDIHPAFYDGYLNGFIHAVFYRESCYNCSYAKLPRQADITIADYAGLGLMEPCKNQYKQGVSQVLINTKKGQKLFNSLYNEIVYEERQLYEALLFNPNIRRASRKPEISDAFFEDFPEKDWDYLRSKYFDHNKKRRFMYFVKQQILKVFGHAFTGKIFYLLKEKKDSPKLYLQNLESYFNNKEEEQGK